MKPKTEQEKKKRTLLWVLEIQYDSRYKYVFVTNPRWYDLVIRP
ncbi:hypothetical protein P9D43_16585 [Neobacillus niacini]|nr:hypothetical protein [Neobacillus niacini]MEC1523623.1 hypothetical protein [Neobacillus niacini]